MKKLLKRYMIFILLIGINVLLLFWKPDLAMNSFNNIWDNVIEMLTIIPPIFVLLGLLDVWVEKETMVRYMGTGSGFKGALIAFLVGSAAAGPLYAAFPVAIMMLKKRASMFNIFIFIGAWSTTKIPMLTFEAANMGMTFTLTRLALSIIGIVIIATIMDKALSKEEKEAIYTKQDQNDVMENMQMKKNMKN